MASSCQRARLCKFKREFRHRRGHSCCVGKPEPEAVRQQAQQRRCRAGVNIPRPGAAAPAPPQDPPAPPHEPGLRASGWPPARGRINCPQGATRYPWDQHEAAACPILGFEPRSPCHDLGRRVRRLGSPAAVHVASTARASTALPPPAGISQGWAGHRELVRGARHSLPAAGTVCPATSRARPQHGSLSPIPTAARGEIIPLHQHPRIAPVHRIGVGVPFRPRVGVPFRPPLWLHFTCARSRPCAPLCSAQGHPHFRPHGLYLVARCVLGTATPPRAAQRCHQ